MAEPIEMPFEGLTHVGPRIQVLDGGPDAHGKGGTFEGDIRRPIVSIYAM